jgi:hypothetical protein
MALKKKISKEVWEKLSKDVQSEYIERDGAYVLDVDGEEDIGALKRAKDREKQLREQAEEKARLLQEQLDAVSDTDARKKGDIETLEKSWGKKLADSVAAYEARIGKLSTFVTKTLIDGTAQTLASKISTVPALMSKAIRERLTVNFEAEEPKLVILGNDGKASDMTIDKLSEEFVANKEFGSIIIGSKATGGGAGQGGQRKPFGGAGTNQDTTVNLVTMNPRDLADSLKAKKESS